MFLRLHQRQDFGLGSPKRVVQFPNVRQPEPVKGRPQLRFGYRLLLQEKLDVSEIFRVGAPHHEERIIHGG